MTEPSLPTFGPIRPEIEQLPLEVTGVIRVDSMPDAVLPEWWQWLSGVLIPVGAVATAIGVIYALGSARRDRKRFRLEMRQRHDEISALRAEQARLMRLSDKVVMSGNAAPNEYKIIFENSSSGTFFDVSLSGFEGYKLATEVFGFNSRGVLEVDALAAGETGEAVLVAKPGEDLDPAIQKPVVQVFFTDENGTRWMRKVRCQPVVDVGGLVPDERSLIARLGDAARGGAKAFARR